MKADPPPMPLTIRKAERRDLASLGRLGAMLMRTHYEFDRQRFLGPGKATESGYASFLGSFLDADDARVFVAEQNDEIIGYVYTALEPLSWKELRGPAGFIHDVAVDERSRHAGVGTKLMQAAIEWLQERGAPRVVLWSAAANDTAQTLFRDLGFRDTMVEMTLELKRRPRATS
jgi:ribosomal protein S18 acetylase RimI-like enzyme